MKIRKKRSKIWLISKEEFEKIVKGHNTLSAILKDFGMLNKGNNFKTLNRRIKEENIDTKHITKNYRNTMPAILKNIIPLEKILIEHSTYVNGNGLKKKLFKEALLENKCYECGQLPVWNNKPLSLHLDHINGIHNDNRIENLRILCPHCHSQTETFAGKNKHYKYKFESDEAINNTKKERVKNNNIQKNKCIDCNVCITKNHTRCIKCNGLKKNKINWPTDEELILLIKNSNFVQVGKILGVSDNAIRKRLKIRNMLHYIK